MVIYSPNASIAVAVVTISTEMPVIEVVESSAVATVCLQKDSETARPLTVIMQPLEVTPTLPDVFQALGEVSSPESRSD